MRIWVLKTGEPVPWLPSEAGRRSFRSGILVEELLRQGHEVVWWTAHFSHQDKKYRDVAPDTLISPKEENGCLGIVYLGSCGYRRHISFRRFLDHAILGRNFKRLAPNLPCPDLIVAAWPIIDLADAAMQFGQRYNIPVVVDVRDLWPDVIYERLPFPARGSLVPYERMARRVFTTAAGVTGVSTSIVDWSRERFGRHPNSVDYVAFHSKRSIKIPVSEQVLARSELKKRGIDLDRSVTRLVWSGNLVPDTDGRTLLAALHKLPVDVADALEVVMCGNGSLVPEIRSAADQLQHLKYAGWLESAQLAMLTEASHIGLLCYLDRFDFRNSVPNKVVDYCAASMRTLTNLGGEVPRLLNGSDSVITYPTGDVMGLVRVLTDIGRNHERYRVKHVPARAIFRQHFDADRVLPEYVSWLEGIAHK